MSIQQWLESGRHLPAPLRDFHDQKAAFKAMHAIVKQDPKDMIRRPDWITGQCYVIDVFLWFMARRGYTLQRSRQKLPFRDLSADIASFEKEETAMFAAMLTNLAQPEPPK